MRTEMAKRIAAIWFLLLVLILLLAGMVAAQERLPREDRKPAPTWHEPSGPAKVLYEQATKFFETGDYAKAAEAYKQITRLRPEDFVAHSLLGFSYKFLGRYNEALSAFKEAVRLNPDIAPLYSELGDTYCKLGRHQEAIEAFKQAIRLNPDGVEAYLGLGLAYGDLGSNLGRQ